MNRVLLLLLLVLTLNLFGKVIPPELLKTESPTHSINPPNTPSIHPNAAFEKTDNLQLLADTIPPVLNCPSSDTIILLTEGKCDTVLNYSVTATDDQGPAIVIQLSGLASGSTFPIGLSTCVFLATDLAGNTATCSFVFTVKDAGVLVLECSDLDTVELDANCTKTLLPQEVLEGGPYGCWSRYFTEVDKTAPFGNGPWLPAVFGANDIGKTYQNRVTDSQTGNKCWGNVKILDKTGPVLNCQDIIVSCAQENIAPAFLKDSLGISAAIPQATDACGPITFLGHLDNNFPYNCDSTFTAIVKRQWQANDQSGNTSTCIQQIKRYRHTISEIQIPPDVTLNCPDTAIAPTATGQPFLMFEGRRYEMQNSSICDISSFYNDYPLALPCGDLRVRRLWELFDFCTGTTEGPFLQNIYILDESSPIVACPPSYTVTLGTDTCHAVVDLPDAVLNDVCSQMKSFQAFWEEDGLAKTLLGSLSDFMGNNAASFDTLGVLGNAVFPVGTTMVSYVAEDSCGNIGDCTFNLTVNDLMPPVANCDTFSTLQLLDDGLLSIGANLLDNGSSDACTPVFFKARFLAVSACLYDTLWSDTLRFCCLNQNDTLDAVLRVYDIPTPSGYVAADFGLGHFSDCAVKITITDPNPPICVAPPNLTVDCKDFDPSLSSYGMVISTSCSVDSISQEADYSQFDSICNHGIITRIFKAFDAAGNIGGCAQAVTVNYLQDYYTKFPDDAIVTVCDGTNDYGEPSFFGQDCEEFEVVYSDEIFNVVPDACYKIERTWKITNKCSYDPDKPLIEIPNPNPSPVNNSFTNFPGPVVSACNALSPWGSTIVKINPTDPVPTNYCTFWQDTANGYTYKQIIKVIDNQAPEGTFVVPICANQNWSTVNNPQLWNETYWWDNPIGTHDLSEEPTDLSFTGTDACSGSNVNIEYLLYLDLDGDGTTETVVNSAALGAAGLGWNTVLFNNLNTPNFTGGTPRSFDERSVMPNEKVGFAIEETVSGNNKTAHVRWNTQAAPNTFFAPELPHGTHKIEWWITDQCGNTKIYNYTFTVKDCKKPTILCDVPLSFNMPASGILTVNATDLLDYAEDNCTPADQIKIAIRKCGTGAGFPIDNNGNPITSFNFTCNDLGPQCIEIWGIDKAGNAEFCLDTAIVQDNSGNCPDPNATIHGRVITEQGVGISDVSFNLENNCPFCPPFINLDLTDSLGYYAIPNNFPIGLDYTIAPEKDDNPLNGVTTYDLVLISKHILGIEPLTTPYKMISADVNKSGSITTFDIVETRKLILGINTHFPNNDSWRFVDSSFVFPNPLNPFQTGFPDTLSLSNPSPHNFIGMKIGDVNNTSVANLNAAAEERFWGTIYLNMEDRAVEESEVFEVKFSASEWVEGCQFTLEMDGLEVLEILPGENMSKENFALFPQKSLLTMAWETGGQAGFTLKMKAGKSGLLRNMLRISSQITPAEGYVLAKERPISQYPNIPISKYRLELRVGNGNSSFELFQNQPNPFAQKTAITFQLPEAGSAQITVMDEAGKVLWSKSGNWLKGLNTVEIDLNGLSAAGVLYYKLETPTNSAVRKMVRI